MFILAANFAANFSAKNKYGGRAAETRKLAIFFTECPHALFCTANVAVTGADEVTKMPTTPCSSARFAPLDSTDYK